MYIMYICACVCVSVCLCILPDASVLSDSPLTLQRSVNSGFGWIPATLSALPQAQSRLFFSILGRPCMTRAPMPRFWLCLLGF